jgi:peptidyl-prolyl cis-trans isomerase D
LQAVFSEDALKLKRNTEAVEVAPNTLVAARVAEYKPASYTPYEELSVELSKRLLREKGNAMAVKQGKDSIAALQKGSAVTELKWGAPILMTRENASTLGREALNQIFRADAAKLPAYVGVENPKGGFLLIKVGKVVDAASIDPAKKKAYTERLNQAVAMEYTAAYLADLKRKADISIKKGALEKTEQ